MVRMKISRPSEYLATATMWQAKKKPPMRVSTSPRLKAVSYTHLDVYKRQGYDHITSAIGGAIAAASGAAFLCYVTPAEHLALPNVEDVKQGIVASKIAAHAADIAKKIPHARDLDDAMADARRTFDWEKQWECSIDPETAKAIRADRAPEHEDSCSMCGKFCAVRSMNKALSGEYIDIL